MIISPWAYPGIKGSKLPDRDSIIKFLKINSEVLVGRRWEELTAEEYVKHKRNREDVNIRFMLFYMLKQNTKMRLKEIGKVFDKDHTTVINGCKKHEAYYENEEIYRNNYNKLIDAMSVHFIMRRPEEKIPRFKNTIL
jgi:uncharacterized Fe-S cluster-containing radical SAM superfamily enzyme